MERAAKHGFMVFVLACALPLVLSADDGADEHSKPVNRVVIGPKLQTSGQPPANYFDELAGQGIGMIVNLAPPESHGSLMDEGGLAGSRGMAYVNIPVDWEAPAVADFNLFSRILAAGGDRSILVHCQVGFRASTFTFLYRVIHDGIEPETALEDVHRVWVPDRTWTAFANKVLADHGVEYELMGQ